MADIFHEQPIDELLVRSAAAVTATAVLWRVVVRRMIFSTRKMWKTIRRVDAEFSPNGGSTMRDAINRIDERTEQLVGRHDMLEQRVAVIEQRVAVIEAYARGSLAARPTAEGIPPANPN